MCGGGPLTLFSLIPTNCLNIPTLNFFFILQMFNRQSVLTKITEAVFLLQSAL